MCCFKQQNTETGSKACDKYENRFCNEVCRGKFEDRRRTIFEHLFKSAASALREMVELVFGVIDDKIYNKIVGKLLKGSRLNKSKKEIEQYLCNKSYMKMRVEGAKAYWNRQEDKFCDLT